ncbi:hypothetical protein AAFF_G00088600 [Aldrovandia affinis]|uniref:TATA box-binding protein-associated factor RNA polymerase I subunit A n=1 Tax=Aldrovandia affinis TaxID=143900 RepID=A0AAD7RWA7_9TELE|nr:hypothetical protein AAFF_G00088600 [Aldrovandia affinis]
MDDIDAEQDISSDELDSSERAQRPSLPLKSQRDQETPFETGFHRTARICLMKIRESLFQLQWQEAADYMSSYFQTLEDTTSGRPQLASEIIWRLGTEILHHHPNTNLEDFNSFLERIKNTSVKTYLEVCLEHSFHLLLNGKFDDAKRQLSIAESWRYGKQSASQEHRIKLVQAYRGFLDYFTWSAKKSSVSGADDSDAAANQEMHNYFRQASVSLKEILQYPGVWDPFVISYVDMLEFYGDEEGALSVLKDYAYDNRFPSNPNAHVYLYQFLKKHKAPEKKLIKALQILHASVPSHELMLELCSLLLQTGRESCFREALTVIFSLLDYSSWKDNLQAWCCMRDVLKLLKRKKLTCFIAEEWESRASWWPAYHFRTNQAKRDFEQSPDLLTAKAGVASALTGRKCMYCMWKNTLLNKAKIKRIKAAKRPLKGRRRSERIRAERIRAERRSERIGAGRSGDRSGSGGAERSGDRSGSAEIGADQGGADQGGAERGGGGAERRSERRSGRGGAERRSERRSGRSGDRSGSGRSGAGRGGAERRSGRIGAGRGGAS